MDVRVHTGGGRCRPERPCSAGTLAVHGAIEGGERFEMELEDPVLGHKLTHAYRVEQLPVEG